MSVSVEMKEEVFEFLDDLRISGEVNMFGSGPFVSEAFGLSKHEARSLVLEWMETFSVRKKDSE